MADHEIGQLLEVLSGEYTVVMFSDPNEFKAYEPEFIEPVHMDLKRHEEPATSAGKRETNSTNSNLPLFEKYQFFTPGESPSSLIVTTRAAL